MDKTAAIFSGGMDSTTLAYMLSASNPKGHLVLISFDYGQRHDKELLCAQRIAALIDADETRASVSHHVINLKDVTNLLTGSALTDKSVDVPDGHYAWESARKTVVPNRNMMMLSIAASIAVAQDCEAVFTGVHAGDHFIYPDCRPEFIKAVGLAAMLGNLGFARPYFDILAPFVEMSKSAIADLGDMYGVPWEETWSCYKGGEIHCGKCPTCVERLEAFYEAGVADRTVYEDSEYWKTVTNLEVG